MITTVIFIIQMVGTTKPVVHYENTPMQYTAILYGCENDNFQLIFCDYLSYFCSKHILWVHVRTASLRRFERVPTIYVLEQNKKIMYTPVNPSFTI